MPMRITLSPIRSDEEFKLKMQGDVLTINGKAFNMAQIPEGALLPQDAVGSPYFVSGIERKDGELRFTLRFPHGPDATNAARFPEPIIVTQDGDVRLPE